MAKFHGVIGYGKSTEVKMGVWEDVITEVPYFGDVVTNNRRLVTGQEVNSDLTVGNSISIIADPYAVNNFFAMRYVAWAGTLWTIENVDVQSPRLILRLGGVYNGPRPQREASGQAPSAPA
jgi:hypothetical protein